MQSTAEHVKDYAREQFPNSQLGLVVAQVRFPALTSFGDSDARLRFQDQLRRDYPLFAPERRMEFRLRSGDDDAIGERGDEILRYSSIEYDWSIVLASDFIALECRSFTRIEDFLPRLREVWRLLVAHFDPRFQLQSSLRFVNELRHPDWNTYVQWRGVLNEKLIGFDPGQQFGGTVSRTIGEFVLSRENDERVLMRRGFLKGTTIAPIGDDNARPARDGHFYLIDNNYVSSHRGSFELDPTERFTRYNAFLHNMFRWSIEREDGNDALLAYLRTPQ